MAGVNKVILVGNLGADPEARSLNNGGEVVNMRIATSEQWKDRDGNRQERTEWHNVVIFNENLGRVAKSYLRKGSKVYLEGQIQTRKWTDQSRQRPLHDRGRAAALPRRAGAARQPRRRRRPRRVQRGFRRCRRRRRAIAAAVSARSRRHSTPTSTTTFRSRSLVASSSFSFARDGEGARLAPRLARRPPLARLRRRRCADRDRG